MDKSILKEAFIVLCAAITITFGSISAIADDFFSDDYIKSADYIIQAAQQSNCTLAALVAKAEEKAEGIAVEVEIEGEENGSRHVEIDILRKQEIVQVTASLATGEILSISQPEFMPSVIEKICKYYDPIEKSKLSMEQAIREAELKTCSTAYRAEIENIDGLLCYRINLFTAQRTLMVMIDPQNGRILSHRDFEHRDDD
ncbi:PepSY domain-containing protein [Desulfovibrio sp. JC010]|uniref:PepSY domain-containing protein n=1 Tax=Desulfovibrio sp. JC010 TaxID=2593641 RepID=UPI0013D6B2E6|nr:PepSY domain-containing protein [Desulfovibrio sp. JC010]NDV26835.1 hypothetical protein [Desulfovibrio sp. JC010]